MGEINRIADRLDALASAVARGDRSELTMRIPAEPERDADIVMSRAAKMLRASRRCSDCVHFGEDWHHVGVVAVCAKDRWAYNSLREDLRTAASCDDYEDVRESEEGVEG